MASDNGEHIDPASGSFKSLGRKKIATDETIPRHARDAPSGGCQPRQRPSPRRSNRDPATCILRHSGDRDRHPQDDEERACRTCGSMLRPATSWMQSSMSSPAPERFRDRPEPSRRRLRLGIRNRLGPRKMRSGDAADSEAAAMAAPTFPTAAATCIFASTLPTRTLPARRPPDHREPSRRCRWFRLSIASAAYPFGTLATPETAGDLLQKPATGPSWLLAGCRPT